MRTIATILLSLVIVSSAVATRIEVNSSLLYPVGENSSPLAVFVADNVTGDLIAAWKHPNLDSATVSRGPGLTVRTESEGFYDAGNWSTSPVFPGLDDPHHFAVRLQVNLWYEAIIETIFFAYQDAGSGESARRLELYGNPDFYPDSLFTDYAVATWPDVDENSVPLPSIAPRTGLIEYRLFGYGAVDPLGVIGFVNTALSDIGESEAALVIFGSLEIIPEPGTFALWIGLAAIFCVVRRRG